MRIAILAKPYHSVFVSFPNSSGEPAAKDFISHEGAKAIRETRIILLAKPYLFVFVSLENSPGEAVAN